MGKDDVSVFIKEKKINVSCHNSWRNTRSEPTVILLENPTATGLYDFKSVSTRIQGYIPHEMCAIVFELVFVAEVNGIQKYELCLGYQIHFPNLGAINDIQPEAVSLILNKGPGDVQINGRDLVMSEVAFD